MMGLLITLFVLLLIASIPLGVHVRYDAEGFRVRLIVWCIRYTVFPFPKKKKTAAQKEPAKKKAAVPAKAAPAAAEKNKGGSVKDFLPFIDLGLRFLSAFRKKLRIHNLQLKLILASDDPCDLAVNYGRAWTAVGNLLPALEKVFRIGKRDVEVECDFAAQSTTLIAKMDITITFGRMIALAAVYGIAAIKEFWKMKKRKGGAAV